MIVYLLTILLSGQPTESPINVMVMKTKDGCEQFGASLIESVVDTIPERGKRMSFTCRAILESPKD